MRPNTENWSVSFQVFAKGPCQQPEIFLGSSDNPGVLPPTALASRCGGSTEVLRMDFVLLRLSPSLRVPVTAEAPVLCFQPVTPPRPPLLLSSQETLPLGVPPPPLPPPRCWLSIPETQKEAYPARCWRPPSTWDAGGGSLRPAGPVPTVATQPRAAQQHPSVARFFRK